ncbi:MAG: hypothetical protein PVF83_05410 [Anaerolineales bacterium]|jgi:hypothetical protein
MRRKRNLLLFTVVIVAVVLACELPGSDSEPKGDIPLDTIVALTIDASNLSATATQAFATANQLPPPLPTDTNQLPPPLPTDTQSLPPSPTPTPTETPIPTLSPTDPKQGLGNPDWKKEFNSEHDWYTYDAAGDRVEIKNGKLFYTMDDTLNYSLWAYAAPRVEDFYLEILATTPAACSGKDRYGIILTPKDAYDKGYLFHLACDGEFRLSIYNGSDTDVLIPWGTNAAIHSGPNQTNTMGFLRNGKKIGIYANGVLIGEIDDDTYMGENKFGVIIHAANTTNFTIAYDDAAYWNLP